MKEFASEYLIKPIAVMESPFRTKFSVPRQSALVKNGQFNIRLLPPYDTVQAVEGITQYSHLWVTFVFHEVDGNRPFAPMVRPPRLGGDAKLGVFATRSPFRPNRLGLSSVRLLGVRQEQGVIRLDIAGADLVNGTPIVDLRPYIAFTDSIPDADSGFAQEEPPRVSVQFSAQAELELSQIKIPKFKEFIVEILAQDPRPAYKGRREQEGRETVDAREYGTELYDYDVHWRALADGILVTRLSLRS